MIQQLVSIHCNSDKNNNSNSNKPPKKTSIYHHFKMRAFTILAIAASGISMASAQCTTWFYSDSKCETLLKTVESDCVYSSCANVSTSTPIQSYKTQMSDSAEPIFFTNLGCDESDMLGEVTGSGCASLDKPETAMSFYVS